MAPPLRLSDAEKIQYAIRLVNSQGNVIPPPYIHHEDREIVRDIAVDLLHDLERNDDDSGWLETERRLRMMEQSDAKRKSRRSRRRGRKSRKH